MKIVLFVGWNIFYVFFVVNDRNGVSMCSKLCVRWYSVVCVEWCVCELVVFVYR